MLHADAKATPLKGIKVLELGSLVAGPYASALLAQFGAEVIKIDSPRGNGLVCEPAAPAGPTPGSSYARRSPQ